MKNVADMPLLVQYEKGTIIGLVFEWTMVLVAY